jgi:hypothetical protein
VEFPELAADLDLGLAADLLTDARPGRAKAKVYRPDVPLPGFVPAGETQTRLVVFGYCWAAIGIRELM